MFAKNIGGFQNNGKMSNPEAGYQEVNKTFTARCSIF
jgi:hypothetical protein